MRITTMKKPAAILAVAALAFPVATLSAPAAKLGPATGVDPLLSQALRDPGAILKTSTDLSQDAGWIDAHGKPAPASEARHSINGLAVPCSLRPTPTGVRSGIRPRIRYRISTKRSPLRAAGKCSS
jgi:hypothetical protein